MLNLIILAGSALGYKLLKSSAEKKLKPLPQEQQVKLLVDALKSTRPWPSDRYPGII